MAERKNSKIVCQENILNLFFPVKKRKFETSKVFVKQNQGSFLLSAQEC